MEVWEEEFEWLKVRHIVKNAMRQSSLPDFQTILFLIGVQELGIIKHSYTKEEKQDLMHIAVCKLLSYDGYYAFKGRDGDGWPHFDKLREVPYEGPEEQERFLKANVFRYFEELAQENGGFEEE